VKLARGVRNNAHLLLAGIRFFNGAAALFAPDVLLRRLEVDAKKSPGVLYFERMFGIRTILLALDLVTGSDEDRRRALRRARIIHGSDTATAALAGLSGNLAPRPAMLTTMISFVNFLLALIARPPRKGGPFGLAGRR
jgi:hypothetical protein